MKVQGLQFKALGFKASECLRLQGSRILGPRFRLRSDASTYYSSGSEIPCSKSFYWKP